jgi:hypothetical protein
VRHPVVVRCLERWTKAGEAARIALRGRWRHLEQASGPPTVVQTLPAGTYSAYLLTKRHSLSEQEVYHLGRSAQVVCVLIGSPVDGARAFFCGRILDSGLPVVVWVRQPPKGRLKDCESTLRNLVQAERLSEFHRAVWEQRQPSWGERSAAQLGRNLGLMYEDPTRIPPEVRGGSRMSGPAGRRAQ